MSIKFIALKEISKQAVPAGFRLSRVINKGTGSTSYGLHVPAFSPTEISSLLQNAVVNDAVIEFLNGLQDKLVRSAVIAACESAVQEINEVDINAEMLVAFLQAAQEEKQESFRLSGEKIAAWFSTELATLLAAAIRAKTPAINEKLLVETLESFSKHFQTLAKKEVSMKESVKKQLEKALALLPDDHSNTVTEAISKKLADAPEASIELDAL